MPEDVEIALSILFLPHLVIEHLFKVGHVPVAVSAVSCKPLGHMIMDSTPEVYSVNKRL